MKAQAARSRGLLPVPDGTYTIRLDFADPQASGAGQRVFDVQLQGQTVQGSYDIYAAAGASYKATELTFSVNASGGSGIVLDLVGHATSYGPLLSGIELSQANPAGGVANPTVNLQLSSNSGYSWSTIATGLTMDRFGNGTYAWTVPSNQSTGSYELRVVSVDYPSISGASLSPFRDLVGRPELLHQRRLDAGGPVHHRAGQRRQQRHRRLVADDQPDGVDQRLSPRSRVHHLY